MEGKKAVILLALILLLVIAAYAISRRDEPALMTPEQVALNYSQFFSIKHNEPNVKEGEFRLFPWKNETFRTYSDILPKIQEKETTQKQELDGGRKLTIKTETAYWFEPFYLGPDGLQQIKMLWGSGEIVVPVYIKILVLEAAVDQNSAQYLSGLADGSHFYKLRVAASLGGNSTIFQPTEVFESLPNIKVGNLRYLPDILRYSTTEPWLGELRRMTVWKLIRAEPIYQKLQRGDKFSDDERQAYYRALNQISKQARNQVGGVIPPFSPTVLADNGIIFTIPVIIEEIDGVKINYRKD